MSDSHQELLPLYVQLHASQARVVSESDPQNFKVATYQLALAEYGSR